MHLAFELIYLLNILGGILCFYLRVSSTGVTKMWGEEGEE